MRLVLGRCCFLHLKVKVWHGSTIYYSCETAHANNLTLRKSVDRTRHTQENLSSLLRKYCCCTYHIASCEKNLSSHISFAPLPPRSGHRGKVLVGDIKRLWSCIYRVPLVVRSIKASPHAFPRPDSVPPRRRRPVAYTKLSPVGRCNVWA